MFYYLQNIISEFFQSAQPTCAPVPVVQEQYMVAFGEDYYKQLQNQEEQPAISSLAVPVMVVAAVGMIAWAHYKSKSTDGCKLRDVNRHPDIDRDLSEIIPEEYEGVAINMNKKQVEDGVAFFTCPVECDINPESTVVFYDNMKPRVYSNATIHRLRQDKTEERDRLTVLRQFSETAEQIEELQTLESILRITEGARSGEFFGQNEFECPLTRVCITNEQLVDARRILSIFVVGAVDSGIKICGIDQLNDELLKEGKDLLNQVAVCGSYNLGFIDSEIKLLQGFGIKLLKESQDKVLSHNF